MFAFVGQRGYCLLILPDCFGRYIYLLSLFYIIDRRYNSMCMFLLLDAFPLCDVDVHRVQSAGEAESEPSGYQTETRLTRAGLGR
jgi:hypothetical protein